VAAFAATNLDDLFLLVAWFAAGTRVHQVVLGQALGIGALFAISVVAAVLTWVLPQELAAWLGLLPIVFGITMLLHPEPPAAAPAVHGVLAVASVTIANGGDNLGTYIPLFANTGAGGLALTGAIFAGMTVLWCMAAHWLVRHPDAGAPIRRLGPKAVPWVLIGIGLWIVLR
jgi:cadmium resistance protein CadD (predicted permease)